MELVSTTNVAFWASLQFLLCKHVNARWACHFSSRVQPRTKNAVSCKRSLMWSKIVIRDRQHVPFHAWKLPRRRPAVPSCTFEIQFKIHLMLWWKAEIISKSMSLLWWYSDMHLQAMGPVQALLPLLYECQIDCCGSQWQWTVSSTRTYALKMYCWQHNLLAVNCQCEHLWSTSALLPSLRDKWLMGVKKAAFITWYISCRE